MLRLTFNPGLALTGFRTTPPSWVLADICTWNNLQCTRTSVEGDSLQQTHLVCKQNGKSRRVSENWNPLEEGACTETRPLRES